MNPGHVESCGGLWTICHRPNSFGCFVQWIVASAGIGTSAERELVKECRVVAVQRFDGQKSEISIAFQGCFRSVHSRSVGPSCNKLAGS
jgi:hypothetical protein